MVQTETVYEMAPPPGPAPLPPGDPDRGWARRAAGRVRSPRGVVDFLDVGFGAVRWPVFNIADIAVTIGAILLAISLWKEEQSQIADGE